MDSPYNSDSEDLENLEDETVADWGQIKGSSIGDPSPVSSIRSSSIIGDGTASVILGFQHNLLQSLSYDVYLDDPALIARAYIPPPHLSPNHLAEQFLSLTQSRDDNTNLGWGLRVEPVGYDILTVERGFFNSRWPVRLRYGGKDKEKKKSTTTPYVEKLTSYVEPERSFHEDGKLIQEPPRLVQAMVIASRTPHLEVNWKLGGSIQLLTGQLDETIDEIENFACTYSTTTSCEGQVLTLTGKVVITGREYSDGPIKTQQASSETTICLDISLFIDGKAIKLGAQEEITAAFVDITRSGSFTFPTTMNSIRIVAVISLRNPSVNPKPSQPRCPTVGKLREDLRVGFRPKRIDKSLSELLEEKAPKLHLREIPTMIASTAHRVLSCLLPYELEAGVVAMLPIRNALHGYAVSDFDVQECFWLLRFLTMIGDSLQIDRQYADPPDTDSSETDAQKPDAQKTDSQKTDTTKPRRQKKLSQKEDLQRRIPAAVRGLVVLITANPSERYSEAENVAYGALSICCARNYLDRKTFQELAPEFGYDAFYDADRNREEIKDPTTRLLQWAHLKAIEHIDRNSFAKADVDPQTLIQQKYDLALDRTDLRTVFNEEADGAEEDLGSAIIREELWNKIALLAIDMFDVDSRSLADEVSQRMAARETDLLGKIPPWGLRCLDHAIHVELAAMRAKHHLPVGDIREIIQSAYENVSYFLRSDFSLLRCSSGTVDPSWASDLWGLDSVIVCCSLLSLMLQEFLRDEDVVAEVFKPAQKGLEFPWTKSLIHGNQHYPLFIRISLEDRRLDQDKKAFSDLFHAVKNEDVDSKLVTHISPDPDTLFKDMLVTEKWSLNDLTFGDGRMCVLDFPFKKSFLSTDDGDLRGLLSKSRVKAGASYRFIMVDYLPREMIGAYLFFAHREAQDSVVDYFGWKLSFRGSIEGGEAHDSSGEVNWYTAVTIPHFLYKESWTTGSMIDVVREQHKVLERPDDTVILEVCVSVCITGDGRGLFWSSSLLGARKIPDQTPDRDEFAPLKIGERIKRVMDKFKYDRYAARNLVFIIKLAVACHVVSERLEKVMQTVRSVLDLDSSIRLYDIIMENKFTQSRAQKTTDITKALRKVLWGVSWLGKLDKCATSTLTIIGEAMELLDDRLSKRRVYWDETLKEFAHEVVFEEHRRARHRLLIFQSRVQQLKDTATNVEDNLISLTNMSMTRAVLATTIDTSQMRILAALTAIFLPFTLVAVVLTIPMFKWPDPPDGQVYIKAPLIIYFAVSFALAALTGLFMRYYTEDNLEIVREWLGRNSSADNVLTQPNQPQSQPPPPPGPGPTPESTQNQQGPDQHAPAQHAPVPQTLVVPAPIPFAPNQLPQGPQSQPLPTRNGNQHVREKAGDSGATSPGPLKMDTIQESGPPEPAGQPGPHDSHKDSPLPMVWNWIRRRNRTVPRQPDV